MPPLENWLFLFAVAAGAASIPFVVSGIEKLIERRR
jgi:hypothetical protein